MNRYDHYTDKFIADPHDTQYGILSTNLAEVGTMTNAEAIDVIRDYLVNKVDNEPMQKACQLAIKALSAEPQIIRCKDCKYYSRNQLIPPCTDGCVAFGKWYGEDDVSPTDFCSFAERMEVDNENSH